MPDSIPKKKPSFRDSAAIVLIRGTGEALETFWVRRSDTVSYMPGFQAFTGGKVAPEDADLPLEGVSDERERVLMACAIREAFEETGALVALAAPVDSGPLDRARAQLLSDDRLFPDLAQEHGWHFDAARLMFAGRWQTPPFSTMRFDTCFYVARIAEGQTASVIPGELAHGEWVRPIEALHRWRLGEGTFAAPILWTLIAFAEGENGLAERLPLGPERSRTPFRRIELKWGIVLHPMKTRPLPPATHTNAYLVGEKEMALIDPGSGDRVELDALFETIDALEAEGRALKLVLLTHHHGDHTEGVAAVRERYRVQVAAHPLTAKRVAVEFTIEDGQTVPLVPGLGDWTLRALHTPGHTADHLCYLHARTGSLFSGDHIPGGRGTVIIDPPDGDMRAYLGSLERLLNEPIQALFPAHGSPQGGVEHRIRGLIEHRLNREAKVREALGGTPQTLRALVEQAYSDTKPELWRYAERSLLAHLLKLESEGHARRDGERWRASG